MTVRIFDIEFLVNTELDEFNENTIVNFAPIVGNPLVREHFAYFNYTARINQEAGSIVFEGVDIDNFHYANAWFKTSAMKNNPFIWFSFKMSHFKDYLLLQTEHNKFKLTTGSNLKFLLTNDSILDLEIEQDPTESIHFGDLKLSGHPYLLTQEQIDVFKNENIIVAANIYGHLVSEFFPEHHRLERAERTSKMDTNERCSLYLMKDLSNSYYKIGISNTPEYRERTLQSEKPSIIIIK